MEKVIAPMVCHLLHHVKKRTQNAFLSHYDLTSHYWKSFCSETIFTISEHIIALTVMMSLPKRASWCHFYASSMPGPYSSSVETTPRSAGQ